MKRETCGSYRPLLSLADPVQRRFPYAPASHLLVIAPIATKTRIVHCRESENIGQTAKMLR
jgi:hypothetical protein